ncbi:GNAT domain-containing protein, partial [Phyllosticta citriasiana]
KTARLCLRRLRVEDAEDVHLIRSRPEVMVYFRYGPETSTRSWIRGCLSRPDVYNFAMELLAPEDNQRVIGLIGAVEAPEIGYLILPDFWGCGLATEALQAFMPLYWQQFRTEFDFASAQIDPDNGASKKGFAEMWLQPGGQKGEGL